MPHYRILEWNESNYDLNLFTYVKEAYEAAKFAFVSDVARGYALYTEGGIYLDTDVELLRSFDSLLDHRSFWGFEAGNYVATSTIGAEKGNELIKAYLDQYSHRRFLRPEGGPDLSTNVWIVTEMLKARGLRPDNTLQVIGNDNTIYPKSYFSPYDYRSGVMNVRPETVTIHHYSNSWNSTAWFRIKRWAKNSVAKVVGKSVRQR